MRFQLKSAKGFLALSAVLMALTFSGWVALLNNFAVEAAHFTGREIGLLQSFREIPGFLAFTAVFILLAIREQTLAVFSLGLMSIGVAATGFFPFEYGLYATTVIMSIGFHYFETVNNSLSLQWLSKEEAPSFLGKIIALKAVVSLIAYGLVWVMFSWLQVSFQWAYLVFGGMGLVLFLWLVLAFPQQKTPVEQHKKLVFRRRYWLFYLLTFFSGARRQIFMVFAGFMMVEKFGYRAEDIALLYIINHVVNLWLAPKIGHIIGRIGERKALTIEYSGLILVFSGYAFVDNEHLAAGLYVLDHAFFAMAIAVKTFFQKIADPADIASSSGVSFTINHIAAVIIPASFGLLWLISPSAVFLAGAGMAAVSLVLSQWVDKQMALAKIFHQSLTQQEAK